MAERRFGSPNMSDTTLLVSVEDLINMAMGPNDKNVVNFKLIQMVLHILARQMRMLEQRVEIRVSDERERKASPPRRMDDIREERKSRSPDKKDKFERKLSKDREKAERDASKQRDKAERAASKEREKAERAASKDRDKAEKAAAKDKEKAERAASKDREKAERAASKDREKAERAASKDREKVEKEAMKGERAASKEREKAAKSAEKEKDKADRAASKERDKADKAASKEQEKADRAASKEREKAEKAAEKGDRAASKEREKAEKAAAKEKEKEEKAAAKASGKADKADAKEREKAEKAAAKEREKADKASAKEKEKADKASAKEKEKAELGKKGKKGKAVSDTSIVVSEVERRKEKVLVVEKGPTTRADKGRESIEVVTRSQFDIVEALVKDLERRAGPLPAPALPDNEKLRSDLAKGQASLTDTMQAMQVTARVRAAEQAIGRMGDLLTQLAAAGALPEDMAEQIGEVKFEPPDMDAETSVALPSKTKSAVSRKSVAIDPMTLDSDAGPAVAPRQSVVTAASRASLASRRASVTSRASLMSTTNLPAVTHPEMDVAIRNLRDDLQKSVQNMTAKATAIAESASASAKAVSDKLDIALMLDKRISTLYSLTSDYAEQLSGFDSGLTTQMTSFRDQMTQMRTELQAGLKQLEQVNNNAETAAVLELTERYEGLVTELDHTLHAHRTLTSFQKQLADELHSLVECVEMLREQKADRDEVLDGLRDKADNTRLAGLLTSIEFAAARLELEKRLDVCHDKFRRQENVWMTALKDLTHVTENKAEITQLLAAREQAETMLRELQDKQMKLAVILGEPKAAMLTRALARGASCGACLAPALMEPLDKSYGAPPPLPAMRPRPLGQGDEPCAPAWQPPEPPDNREHTCHRWVGGSHTLLSDAVTRERAPPLQLHSAPTNKYTGYGDDGRLYMLEEELQPCVECNKFSEPPPPTPPPPGDAAGDLGAPPPPDAPPPHTE